MILNYFFLNIPNLLDYHVPTYLNNYFHLFTNSQKKRKRSPGLSYTCISCLLLPIVVQGNCYFHFIDKKIEVWSA